MRIHLSYWILLFLCSNFSVVKAQPIVSPDEKLQVDLKLKDGALRYSVLFEGEVFIEDSPLGLDTHIGDFTKNLSLIKEREETIQKSYMEEKIKQRQNQYNAVEKTFVFENKDKRLIEVIFRVSNNNLAFRYHLPKTDEASNAKINKEISGYKFPKTTTTFLTPQAPPMSGWNKTKPSYEEEYGLGESMKVNSKYGLGYTFPGLFKIGDKGWVLLSETEVDGNYLGAKLNDVDNQGVYKISYPEKGENNGIGSAFPTISLPGYTPWRTITVGKTLKPIVETTIPFDLVEPKYKPSQKYKFGRTTWSWLMWQDSSINFEDQIRFIDLAADMEFEYTLIDGNWDTEIGYEKVKELVDYANNKKVGIFLWYNSNGFWNNAPQTPKNRMNSSVVRKREMAWMHKIGVKGIKVDFFGGDKQETLKLYEEILTDANDYGLMVIFHGATLPRGWERMYPNFVGSEAVLASENLIFTQHANDEEALNASLHPFIRNAVASMEFGPVLLNKYHNKENDGGTMRKTGEIFQIATAVLFQNPVQVFGIAPNNLKEEPSFIMDFLKEVPTTWDETRFIEGYPGKYVVLARRHDRKWYIVGVNAESNTKEVEIDLSQFFNNDFTIYRDGDGLKPVYEKNYKNKASTKITVKMESEGGFIIKGPAK